MVEEKRGIAEGKMLLLASDIKRGKVIWKISGEKSKRRLRNYAERNDCQLSRYGDYRSRTQDEKRGGGGGGGRGRNSDGPTSSLAILTCKGWSFHTCLFSNCFSFSYFILFSFSPLSIIVMYDVYQ